MNQTDAVLEWLKTGAGITTFEAFEELGVTRLSAIIFRLRDKGYSIKSETLWTVNRYGAKVKYSRYYLES